MKVVPRILGTLTGVFICSLPFWGIWAWVATGGELPPGWGVYLLLTSTVVGALGIAAAWFVYDVLEEASR